jgi:hypothetical protein
MATEDVGFPCHMVPNSRKALDLRRDPRFPLQANPGPDTEMAGGDVRLSRRAVDSPTREDT